MQAPDLKSPQQQACEGRPGSALSLLLPVPPGFVSCFICLEPPEGRRGSWGMPVPALECVYPAVAGKGPWSLGWSGAHGLGVGCGSAVPPPRFPAVAGMDLLPFAIRQTIRMLLNPLWSPKAGLLVDPRFLCTYDLCGHQVAP